MGDRRRPWKGVAAVLGHCRARLVVVQAGGVVCGRGEPFEGGGHRLGVGGVVCGRGGGCDGCLVVAEVIWWLALSC